MSPGSSSDHIFVLYRRSRPAPVHYWSATEIITSCHVAHKSASQQVKLIRVKFRHSCDIVDGGQRNCPNRFPSAYPSNLCECFYSRGESPETGVSLTVADAILGRMGSFYAQARSRRANNPGKSSCIQTRAASIRSRPLVTTDPAEKFFAITAPSEKIDAGRMAIFVLLLPPPRARRGFRTRFSSSARRGG